MTNEQHEQGPLSKRLAAAVLSAIIAFPPGSLPVLWAEDGASVDSIKVAGDQVQIGVSAETQYTSRVTATPPRLILDLSGTQYKAGAKAFTASGQYLKGVRGSQFKPSPEMVSRVVLDLKEMTGYQISRNAGGLLVALGPSTSALGALHNPAGELPKPKGSETAGVSTQVSPEVTDIAVKSDVTKTEAEEAPPAVVPQASDKPKAKGHIDIMGRLPRDLVSLDFDNTDIRDVIKLLAAKAKVNIIYGPDVSGNLSLHLSDVPFDEAFRTILTMMNLSTSQVGENILRILTPAALRGSQTAAATATKVVTLNYSKASDILGTVNSVRTAEGRAGTAIADAKTNSIIVTESIEGLARTELLISQLDQKPKQVVIEAKIVEVGLTKALDYGIQWDYFEVDPAKIGHKAGTNMIGTTAAPSATAAIVPPLDRNATVTTGVGAGGRGTGVRLPADNIFGALTLGRITNNYFLSATLTAAASEGKVKVLSDPKVATLNNQAANINVTTQIPYVTSNATANTVSQSVAYVTVGIQLTVTPTINADGRITLNINPVVSQPSATAAASSTGAPAVDSRNAQTTVLVKDGETIVIGGLISDSVQNTVAKVPILGDIPIIGWLFKKKTISRSRTELLIFVTPKVMND
ncbi:MAG: type IV pilus secretin PilQ [Elusimicrobia bacterium]|nr:type IV pilus secretin PilQ [Elusimicrobiota bacterium]